jgi:hypothetical protein
MNTGTSIRRGARWLATGAGLAAGAYAAYAAVTWLRYGRVSRPREEETDELLDRFMPEFEVVERHHLAVTAPAALTIAAAKGLDAECAITRALFDARAIALGGSIDREALMPQGLEARMVSIGWTVLGEVPGREIVFGAVTKPWHAKPAFRSVPAADFAAFNEPDYVKIVWTLRADPAGDERSIFRTETRACATDREARRKFRLYWAFVQPGVAIIRYTLLGPIKQEAERRAKRAAADDPVAELRTAV